MFKKEKDIIQVVYMCRKCFGRVTEHVKGDFIELKLYHCSGCGIPMRRTLISGKNSV